MLQVQSYAILAVVSDEKAAHRQIRSEESILKAQLGRFKGLCPPL
jgi:hypothetical protein